jgi:hypothetical protein
MRIVDMENIAAAIKVAENGLGFRMMFPLTAKVALPFGRVTRNYVTRKAIVCQFGVSLCRSGYVPLDVVVAVLIDSEIE